MQSNKLQCCCVHLCKGKCNSFTWEDSNKINLRIVKAMNGAEAKQLVVVLECFNYKDTRTFLCMHWSKCWEDHPPLKPFHHNSLDSLNFCALQCCKMWRKEIWINVAMLFSCPWALWHPSIRLSRFGTVKDFRSMLGVEGASGNITVLSSVLPVVCVQTFFFLSYCLFGFLVCFYFDFQHICIMIASENTLKILRYPSHWNKLWIYHCS